MKAYNLRNENENTAVENKSVKLTKVCTVSLAGVIATSVLCANMFTGTAGTDVVSEPASVVASGVIEDVKAPESVETEIVPAETVEDVVVKSDAAQSATNTETVVESQPVVEPEAKPEVKVEDVKQEAETVKPEVKVEQKADTTVKAESTVKTENTAKAEPTAKEEPKVETKQEEKPVAKEEPKAETEQKVEAPKETETKKEETKPSKPTYTYTDMSATKYAKSAVNVRNLPSTAGTKLGGLTKAQVVTVTGQCNETGWYRIDFNGGTAYVSNSYLVDEEPVAPAPSVSQSDVIDISHVSAEKAERIKSVIVWEADYSKAIENAVIYELNKLPDAILNGYFAVPDADIIIVGSLSQYDTNYNITGRTEWAYENWAMTRADIYIEGKVSTVQETLIHEVGHYVNAACECVGSDYDLPNFEADAYRFSTTEWDGFDYFAQSEGEYFAELFKYVINNGATDKYADSYKMQSIINNFKGNTR